ncbi:MAG: ATP-binding protein [Rhodothermales bacterium]|nr:ATP-binding protein [Rhodothermales bacterium]
MNRSFPRSIDALSQVCTAIDEFAEENIPARYVPTIQLVVEEIFTNMVRHNEDGVDDIQIALGRKDDELIITITDNDSERFDPNEQEEVDVSAPLSERKPGGLGIHLVKSLVDELHYRYKDGESVITLMKRIDTENV